MGWKIWKVWFEGDECQAVLRIIAQSFDAAMSQEEIDKWMLEWSIVNEEV